MPKGVLSEVPGWKMVARELRRKQTPAEEALWKLLRHRRLRGLKFRRQFPIGTFVADFCCYELRLVVELDGEVHESPPQAAHDENRDAYLNSRGYTVLRFSNRRLSREPSKILDEIFEAAWQRGYVSQAEETRG